MRFLHLTKTQTAAVSEEVFKLGSDSVECLHDLFFIDEDNGFRHAVPFNSDKDINPKIQGIAYLLWPAGLSVTGIHKIYQSLCKVGVVDSNCILEGHIADYLVVFIRKRHHGTAVLLFFSVIMNAFNLIDGMDGLAKGLPLIKSISTTAF